MHALCIDLPVDVLANESDSPPRNMFKAVNNHGWSSTHAKLGRSATIGGGSINKICH